MRGGKERTDDEDGTMKMIMTGDRKRTLNDFRRGAEGRDVNRSFQ